MNLLLEAESSSYSCDLACDNPSYSLSLFVTMLKSIDNKEIKSIICWEKCITVA